MTMKKLQNDRSDQKKLENNLLQKSRREFLKKIGAGVTAVGILSTTKTKIFQNTAEAQTTKTDPAWRFKKGRAIRKRAARRDFPGKKPCTQRTNRDERNFDFLASYTKGLPHNAIGEVDQSEYKKFRSFIKNKQYKKLENLNLGFRKLKNPQGSQSFGLQGADSHQLCMPPAPAFDSAELAGEMRELYWQAILRDIPFLDYSTHPDTALAAADMSALSDYKGPTASGLVTTDTLFRGSTPGDLIGPYISQFLLQPVPMGSLQIPQQQKTVLSGTDYMTTVNDWLPVQNGQLSLLDPDFDPVLRYIRNGRDLAWYVWNDRTYQAYFHTASFLVDKNLANVNILQGRLDIGNPYRTVNTTEGFVSLGEAHLLSLLGEVTIIALRAVWHQKWNVHRRARPEEIAGRIHYHLNDDASYPLNPETFATQALSRVFSLYGTYLLPQAFIEGSPLHPSYGAGHATVAGACVTILKAFFDENLPFSTFAEPVISSTDGLTLNSYTDSDAGQMTLGGELNKLAANISIGRNFAGIHYRSDYWNSLKLGEEVAIKLLKRQKKLLVESHNFHLTKFNGKSIVI